MGQALTGWVEVRTRRPARALGVEKAIIIEGKWKWVARGGSSQRDTGAARRRRTDRRREGEGRYQTGRIVARSQPPHQLLRRIWLPSPSCTTPGERTPDSDGGSGDVTEEELWVDSYGAWGTSDKGKWKASAFDEDDDQDFHESASASSMHDTHHSNERAANSTAAESDEAFYIYEPIGAPEFLVGSSTSLVARATAGFHSRRRTASSKTHSQCIRRRRRRPMALVLATPEQAEWFADVVLGSAPPDVPRLPQTPKHSERPSTAPGYGSSALDLPARSSPPLPSRRAMSSDVPDPAHPSGARRAPRIGAFWTSPDVITTQAGMVRGSRAHASIGVLLRAPRLHYPLTVGTSEFITTALDSTLGSDTRLNWGSMYDFLAPNDNTPSVPYIAAHCDGHAWEPLASWLLVACEGESGPGLLYAIELFGFRPLLKTTEWASREGHRCVQHTALVPPLSQTLLSSYSVATGTVHVSAILCEKS
ncbi:hypothetical protein NUW54_g398 [Trametes sanguinea]|uniref:Uncharacterized protein n=1 Tax=Trametes sanguinea TaxID=158606 RepID=A0ACC1QB51_9APHY|nr:hypothetical protein NUW54_g398 [Trametes sanguinea]